MNKLQSLTNNKSSSTILSQIISLLNSRWGRISRDTLSVVGGFTVLYQLSKLAISLWNTHHENSSTPDISSPESGETLSDVASPDSGEHKNIFAKINEKVNKEVVTGAVKSIGTWVKTKNSERKNKKKKVKADEQDSNDELSM